MLWQGIIEKLKESYGFIKPLDPESASLFFHYSELDGNPGDAQV